MKKEEWTNRIRESCEKAGVYQPFYDDVIDSLAGLMEMRDNAEEKFVASGGNTVVAKHMKGGEINIVKNPAMVAILDCNAQALNYWHALGLTPKAFKQMTGGVNVKEKERTLEDALADLGI